MDFLHENTSVGSLVLKNPEYAAIFERLGVDYCCKGNKTLKEVCDEKKLNPADILENLKQTPASGAVLDWSKMSIKEIVEYIVGTYHVYARQELPRISQLLKKLNLKHGEKYPYIPQLQNIFEKMKDALLEHMDEEEEVLFPLAINLAINKNSHREEIKKQLSVLNEDHLESGEALEKIKELTNNYTPPADACMTHIVVLNSLERFERNLHEHIHKENQILFPHVEMLLKNA